MSAPTTERAVPRLKQRYQDEIKGELREQFSSMRAVWERDLAHAQRDIGRLERFFTDVMDGRLTGADVNRAGFEFIATEDVPQGAFYTVGWLMGSTIERVHGRDRLVSGICSPTRLILDYADAARRPRADDVVLPAWSPAFITRLASLPR